MRKRHCMTKTLLIALAFACVSTGIAHAKAAPACADDAAARAESLIKFHVTDGGQTPEMADDVAPVDAGRYDVLEVTGYVIKAEYRVHLIYADMQGQCLLMGQEIIEVDSPF